MNNLLAFFLKLFPWMIIIYGGYSSYAVFSEYQINLENVRTEIQVVADKTILMKKKIKEIEEFKKNLEVSRLRIEEINKQMEMLKKQLPNAILDTEVLDFFSNEASNLNVQKLGLSPLREVKESFYFSKQFSVQGTGTYLQFLVFFERILNQERIYNVKKMELHNSNDQKGRFQLLSLDSVIEVFRYNPEQDSSAQAPSSPSASPNSENKI